ncbi:hypothetical protein RDV84_00405 [Lysobacter yananisis]|uniref:Lipoprotein n=1 Tax=Lysobacter yananisis TaxID=1003114 RepID=A0ABY9P8E1_9GAMM|nr:MULTISPECIES: hypothetical protein [Lysobacter]UZW59520.1 hypothetical protein BV903_019790 [Lysobacter enzymogenes]WMT03352.1 hypothetical protein RDV84_00405 [Lysobacter yananisis]
MRLLIPALLALTFVGCSCQRNADDNGGDGTAPPAQAQTPETAAAPSAAQLRAQALEQRRNDAYTDAVGTLHLYLQRVGAGDQDAADKFWGYQRMPRGNEESNLRALKNLRGLRIQNQTPEPLDQEPVPELLRIPVDLRATLENGENRRYTGWYRLRRNQVEQRWELTGVLVAAKLQ